jgi:ATP-binding cassette subfamily B multidrug efflux pump
MRRFLWEMRPYFRQVAGQLVLGSIAGIVMNTAIVLPAILLGRAIDAALALGRGETEAGAVVWAAVAFVAGTAFTEAARVLKRWWLATANARIRSNLRADALRGVLAWPMERLHRTSVGDVMARVIGDVEVLGVGVREFTIEIWDTVLFSISLIVAMLIFDLPLTLLALIPVPIAMTLAHATGRWMSRRTTAAREANGALTAAIQELLTGVRVLRLFGRESAAIERVEALSLRFADTNLAIARLRGGLVPVYTSLMTAGVVVLVWLGGERVISGTMSVGEWVAYLELFLRFVTRGFRVPQLVNSIQSGAAAYARLRPLLAPALGVRGEPPYASFRLGHVTGLERTPVRLATYPKGPVSVALEHATFQYPGAARPALTEISLQVPPGALMAVTGPVGSGKSALARALLGLYPLESGRVVFDGRPIDEVSAGERAARTGYLPQDGYLFSGSVRGNVALFAGDDAVAPAPFDPIRLAALEEDVLTFPDGLETQIGDQGIRVSGGQRQRIGLARALSASGPGVPGLLVLDDPFSAVDVDTEIRIIEALRDAFGPRAPRERQATIVLCSHRLAAFPRADLVVVLERGEIVERGTHESLMRAQGLYARMYLAQQRFERGPEAAEAGPVVEART